MLSLFVDDSGEIYTAKNDALHLIDTMKEKSPGTNIDWSGKIFPDIYLDWDHTKLTVTLSMPNYVNKAL